MMFEFGVGDQRLREQEKSDFDFELRVSNHQRFPRPGKPREGELYELLLSRQPNGQTHRFLAVPCSRYGAVLSKKLLAFMSAFKLVGQVKHVHGRRRCEDFLFLSFSLRSSFFTSLSFDHSRILPCSLSLFPFPLSLSFSLSLSFYIATRSHVFGYVYTIRSKRFILFRDQSKDLEPFQLPLIKHQLSSKQ